MQPAERLRPVLTHERLEQILTGEPGHERDRLPFAQLVPQPRTARSSACSASRIVSGLCSRRWYVDGVPYGSAPSTIGMHLIESRILVTT